MLSVSVSSDISRVLDQMQAFREQVPFATAKALTQTAGDVQKALREAMPKSLDRPTPYTLNSLFRSPATKSNLEARVWLKDDAGKGTPASKYLLPQIRGGARRQKRFESALARIGALPPGHFAVPALGAKLDQFGNVRRGQIVQILSALQAFSEQGYVANRRAAQSARQRGNAPQFFVSRGDRGLPIGVYQRFSAAGGYVKPVFLFVPSAHYSTRFDFFGIGRKTVAENFQPRFAQAMRDAIATAK